MAEVINLTSSEVEYIKKNKKLIGKGVDGALYNIKGDILYKLYHDLSPEVLINNNAIYDSEGVNISGVLPFRRRIAKFNNIINYVDSDGVILCREEALNKAIEKQKKIKRTLLPQGIVKENNRVIGCIYKKYNTIWGIYATSCLPLEYRYNVCRKVIYKVQELLDNNIYLTTLAQRNEILSFSKKDSNVLLDYKLEPLIIDLDGISALYSDTFIDSKYKVALCGLSKLVLEIITKRDLSYEYLDNYKEEYIQILKQYNIDLEYIHKFYDYGYLEIEELKNVLIKKKS